MNDSFDETDLTPEEEERLVTEDDLDMLREDLVGELQAINQYQEHIESLGSEEAMTWSILSERRKSMLPS